VDGSSVSDHDGVMVEMGWYDGLGEQRSVSLVHHGARLSPWRTAIKYFADDAHRQERQGWRGWRWLARLAVAGSGMAATRKPDGLPAA
jgi:hypothetical protein